MTTAASTTAPALLEATGLRAGYGAISVLHGLDIAVHPGEVVVLLGPNGAGKSTTLKALSGDIGIQAGSVLWDGQATRASLHRRARSGLSYVTEEKCVFFRLSTIDNLRIGQADPADVIAMFPELEPRLRTRVGDLSGGEQQMLAVGRAIARNPRILFADELSLGLAPIIVQRLLSVIREQADKGVGVLLVEQHVRQVLGIADRVYVMRRGRIVMSLSAAEARERLHEIEASYMGEDLEPAPTKEDGV